MSIIQQSTRGECGMRTTPQHTSLYCNIIQFHPGFSLIQQLSKRIWTVKHQQQCSWRRRRFTYYYYVVVDSRGVYLLGENETFWDRDFKGLF